MGDDDKKVTAAVSEDPWKDLEIPPFLRRTEATSTAPSTPINTASQTKAAPAPAASVSAGDTSGATTNAPTTGVTGAKEFSQFRVDPAEIETKIKQEADRRWRAWMPTKTDRKRPRKSTYEKQVRKEYYP